MSTAVAESPETKGRGGEGGFSITINNDHTPSPQIHSAFAFVLVHKILKVIGHNFKTAQDINFIAKL